MNTESIRTPRLTRKENNNYIYEKPIMVIDCMVGVHYDSGKHIDKLGELEDIEEELGVDLVTLFKALKDGIYIKRNYHGIEHEQVSYIADTGLYKYYDCRDMDEDYVIFKYYDFKDYGKTWALDRNELAKDGQ